MNTWAEDQKIIMKRLRESLGTDTLDIPINCLIEFRFNGSHYVNATMKCLGRIFEQEVSLDKGDKLCGVYNGEYISSFFRARVPNRLSSFVEANLSRNNISYVKLPEDSSEVVYACNMGRLQLSEVTSTKPVDDDLTCMSECFLKASKQLAKKILF